MNYAILVLIGISLIIPGAYAEPDVATSITSVGDPAISLDIKAPQENKIFLNLGQPPHITVIGYVRNSQSVQSVIVSSSEGSTDCGNTSFISCTIPVTKGLNRITITAMDPNGSHVSTTRNFSVQYGVPGLPTRITISGKITTPDGHPIEGAMVRTHYTESAIAESEADGSYRINNARGFRQIMSVEKEGYTNVTKEMVFNKNLNTVDFILEPTTKSVAGFTAILCLVGILGTLLIISRKERTR